MVKLLCVVVIGSFASSENELNEDHSAELKRLQGKWIATSFVHQEKEMLGTEIIRYEWELRDDVATITVEKPDGRGQFHMKLKVVPSKKPKEFNTFKIDITDGIEIVEPEVAKQMRGIYKLEGNKLTRCYTRYGEPSPKDFNFDAPNTTIIVMERIDSDNEK